MSRIVRHHLFWPLASLLTLIALNTIVRPQFIKITVRDGELYGALIDILRNCAPLMLVALGMTLVIATRGIDVGAKADIQRKVAELSSQGLSVIFISSELEEVLRLAQRVVVMRDRHQIGVLDSSDVDVDGLIDYMANQANEAQTEGSVA